MDYLEEQSGLARVADKVRLVWGKKCLDLAELLPHSTRGLLSHLQLMRKHQREQAARSLETSRLPEDIDIRYPLCIQMELFPVERIDILNSAIAHYFPEEGFFSQKRNFIDSIAPSLLAGGYSHVGTLVRKSNFLFGGASATVSNLPADVQYIAIDVYKVLSSIFVVRFSSYLNDGPMARVREQLNRMYLPATRFKYWIPHGFSFISHSETPSDLVREKSVLRELLRVRVQLEEFIGQRFQGYFFGQCKRKEPRLPTIERFDLTGVPSEGEFLRWGWGEPLGLHSGIISFDGYRADKQIFVFGGERNCDRPLAHRWILLHDVDEGAAARNERLHSLTDQIIANIVGEITVLEFLTQIRSSVESLRVRIYRRLAGSSYFMRFRKDIRLHRDLQKESLLLNRLGLEVSQGEKLHGSRPHPAASFEPIRKGRKKDLGEALSAGVHFQLETISSHIDFVTKSFSDFVVTRNMELTFRLQIQVYVLTALAFILALLPVITANWSWIKSSLYPLIGVLH